MDVTTYQRIRDSLRHLYLDDPRPWLVGFSGGKDSTMVASLIVETIAGIPDAERKKPVAILCTDTRVEAESDETPRGRGGNPAVAETIESTLDRIRKFSEQNNLNIEANLLKPPPEQSFWVNIIGRGYPPPNRILRWCTQRLKLAEAEGSWAAIDPVTTFVQQKCDHGCTRIDTNERHGRICHKRAQRAQSTTSSFIPHPSDLPKECPIQIDTSTPSCGNSRFEREAALGNN